MAFFVFALELVGTAAFAVSGAMVGLKKRMDVFGVCVMGLVTACGGGVLRDLFLDRLPPTMFLRPVYALTAIGVSLVMFLPAVRRALSERERAYELVLLLSDSVGLGVFTAAGVDAAFGAGYGESLFFAVFLGAVTGVGGGVIRDVLAGMPPAIFVRHIYALASIGGAALCALLRPALGETAAMTACAVLVLAVRLLAAHYRWSLPKAEPIECEPGDPKP